MSTDDILKASAKRQEEIKQQKEQAEKDEDFRRREEADKTLKNAIAIDARFRSALNYLTAHDLADAKKNGFDSQHWFQSSAIHSPSPTPLCGVLHVYLQRGGVVHNLDPNRPYQADYELTLTADAKAGTITAHGHCHRINQRAELDILGSEAELSDSRAAAIFQSFAKEVARCEEERAAQAER